MASVHQGPVGPLRHRCQQAKCSATGLKLLRCAGCLAVRYCTREHQVADRPKHKSVCTKIKKARAKMAEEERLLRNEPENYFEMHVGRFWKIFDTRDYMGARFALAQHVFQLGTFEGVHEAVEHIRDMIRLCRSDNMGLRDILPFLMLRLDLDQECYDFVKWWGTSGQDRHYDWGDMTLPHLNIRGADVLEDPGFLLRKYPSLNHIVAILLLNLKLLVDIRNLKVSRMILARRLVPVELWKQIELATVRSPLSAKLQTLPASSLLKTEATLHDHICKLGAGLVNANQHFMFDLFEPDRALSEKPDSYSGGSWEEMSLTMHNSYAAWWETEGVLDLLKDARACAARDTETEIENLMQSSKFRKGRTAEELLSDMSVNRIWAYLDYATKNASYLGPWADRPSERYTMEARESWARAEADDAESEQMMTDLGLES